MNRLQAITLAVFALNLALLLLFPPYDFVSPLRANLPTFEGFRFAFGDYPNRVVNQSFLYLEVFVVLANAAIAWFLLRDRPEGSPLRRFNLQTAVLLATGANLVLVLLFPPFENYQAVTKAALPSFEGFYFIFGDNRQRVIVTTILYLEVIFIAVNGLLFWLLFGRQKAGAEATTEDILAITRELKKQSGQR